MSTNAEHNLNYNLDIGLKFKVSEKTVHEINELVAARNAKLIRYISEHYADIATATLTCPGMRIDEDPIDLTETEI